MSRATSLQCTARLAPIQPAIRPSSGAAAGYLRRLGRKSCGRLVSIYTGLRYLYVHLLYEFISGYRLPLLVAASHRVTAP
eukprot:COSAG06_NODE_4326_length_4357_cov_3.590621_3_plen_80_part_00